MHTALHSPPVRPATSPTQMTKHVTTAEFDGAQLRTCLASVISFAPTRSGIDPWTRMDGGADEMYVCYKWCDTDGWEVLRGCCFVKGGGAC